MRSVTRESFMKTSLKKEQRLEVFYDGACRLCSMEIDHYRKSQGAEKVRWVDISASDFKADQYGFRLEELEQSIHSRKGRKIYKGVDTFIRIWEELPGYSWMAKSASFPVVRPFLDAGYFAFAKVRPYLPRKECENGVCDIPLSQRK